MFSGCVRRMRKVGGVWDGTGWDVERACWHAACSLESSGSEDCARSLSVSPQRESTYTPKKRGDGGEVSRLHRFSICCVHTFFVSLNLHSRLYWLWFCFVCLCLEYISRTVFCVFKFITECMQALVPDFSPAIC